MILAILDQIASDNSKNFKLKILKEHSDNELFRQVVIAAYCPLTKFYIKQLPEDFGQYEGILNLSEALGLLDCLSNRQLTGDSAREFLNDILSKLSKRDSIVLKRIILKDLRAGFSASSINKAMGKGTIKETPYMGAVSYNEKKVAKLFKTHTRIFSEVKMDGRYSNALLTDSTVYMESRAGNPTEFGNVFDNLRQIRDLAGHDLVLNGELIIPGMSRYQSNGAIASIVSINAKNQKQISITKELLKFKKEYDYGCIEIMDRIIMVVWDYLPLDAYEKGIYNVPRITRMFELEKLVFQANLPNLKFVEWEEVQSVAEASTHFKKCLTRGEEGTILKGGDGIWKDGKPVFQVKFKLEMTVDLQIVGFNYGTVGTKNEKRISSVTAKSSDGLLVTSPAGIPEKTMDFLTENQDTIVDSILEVKCSGLSSNSKGEYSLLHPVFKEIRTDKTKADSLEQIQANEDMIKNLK